jgi:hypothetical protein
MNPIPALSSLTHQHFSYDPNIAMPSTPSKPLYNITVPTPKNPARKATVAAVSKRPKLTTEQALKGYDYLKSRSSRSSSSS